MPSRFSGFPQQLSTLKTDIFIYLQYICAYTHTHTPTCSHIRLEATATNEVTKAGAELGGGILAAAAVPVGTGFQALMHFHSGSPFAVI